MRVMMGMMGAWVLLGVLLGALGCQQRGPSGAVSGTDAMREAEVVPDWSPRAAEGQSFDTPEATLRSLDLAIRRSDLAAMEACLADPGVARRAVVPMLELLAAQARLARKANERFGGSDAQWLSFADSYTRRAPGASPDRVVLLPGAEENMDPASVCLRRGQKGQWQLDAERTWNLALNEPAEVRQVLARWTGRTLAGLRQVLERAEAHLEAGEFANLAEGEAYLNREVRALNARLQGDARQMLSEWADAERRAQARQGTADRVEASER